MAKKILLSCVYMLLVTLGNGCAFNPFEARPPAIISSEVALPIAPISPTALTDEAKQLLLAADKKINDTRGVFALWTKALEKFALAQQAANVFDSEKTVQLARETIALCELSLAQTKLPLVSW
jgi:hypothetical protein